MTTTAIISERFQTSPNSSYDALVYTPVQPSRVEASEIFDELFQGDSQKRPSPKISSVFRDIFPIIETDSSSRYFHFAIPAGIVSSEEFFAKIRKLQVLEDIFGMLNELTPEQRATFESAAKRRPLFE